MVNRDAPYSGLANLMAMNGRFGDTELVHMSKPEIRGLASLGELTVNPDTGLPEAFSLKAALPIIGGIAGSMIMPGIGSALGSGAMGSLLSGTSGMMIGSALGSFGGGLLAGQPFGQAALGGLMAGATSGIFGGAFGGGGEAGQAAGSSAANTGSVVDAGSAGVSTGTTTGVPAATAVAPPMVDSTFGGMKIFNPPPAPVISQPSSLQSWLGANKNKLLLGGAGLAAAGLAGDEGGGEVAPSPPITPLTQYTFNRERREGAPRTEEELRRQATQGGNYSFFGPGAFNPIARANEGGLVSLANQQPAQQRSNVTNFMFSDNPQHQNVFDEMFKVGEAMSQPQQQPNTGLMQLAVGGQPKSNIAQMLNPTLRQQVPSLPPFNYDALRRRASIGQEESPVDIFQTQHEEILRDALGRIVEDSSKEVIETPEEPVAPIAPIPKPVNVFSDDGDPDTAGMSGDDIAGPGVAAAMGMADTEAEAGAAEAAAASDAEAAADAAEIAEGGLVGLANGGTFYNEDLIPDHLLDTRIKIKGRVTKTLKELGITKFSQLPAKGGQAFEGNAKVWGTYNDPNVTYAAGMVQDMLPDQFIRVTAQNDSTYRTTIGNKRRLEAKEIKPKGHGAGIKLDLTFTKEDGTNFMSPDAYNRSSDTVKKQERDEYDKIYDKIKRKFSAMGLTNNKDYKLNANPWHGTGTHADILFKKSGRDKIEQFRRKEHTAFIPILQEDVENTVDTESIPTPQEAVVNTVETESISTPQGVRLHTVEKGDTLWDLGQKYSVSVEEIKTMNENIGSDNTIFTGQEIKIPVKAELDKGITSILEDVIRTSSSQRQAPAPVQEERDMGEYSLRGEGIQDIRARLESTPRSRLIPNRAGGGPINQYFEGQVIGKGDGQSDQILFEVEGKNPDMALLSRDEYVLPADAVAMLGNGSSNAGAKELDQFVKSLRQQSFGTQRQQQRVNPQRGLSALV